MLIFPFSAFSQTDLAIRPTVASNDSRLIGMSLKAGSSSSRLSRGGGDSQLNASLATTSPLSIQRSVLWGKFMPLSAMRAIAITVRGSARIDRNRRRFQMRRFNATPMLAGRSAKTSRVRVVAQVVKGHSFWNGSNGAFVTPPMSETTTSFGVRERPVPSNRQTSRPLQASVRQALRAGCEPFFRIVPPLKNEQRIAMTEPTRVVHLAPRLNIRSRISAAWDRAKLRLNGFYRFTRVAIAKPALVMHPAPTAGKPISTRAFFDGARHGGSISDGLHCATSESFRKVGG